MKKIIYVVLSSFFFTVGFSVAFSMNASAYIDPSVMTYALQAVAGIIIAVGAALGIYFRKIKRNINKKLGVDENRNKEVETDEIIIKEEDKNKNSIS